LGDALVGPSDVRGDRFDELAISQSPSSYGGGGLSALYRYRVPDGSDT